MPTFIPPTVFDNPAVLHNTTGVPYHLFKFYGPYERGRCVVRVAGVYSTVDYPDQTLLASATEVYLGGHEYAITSAVATALTDAGYGANIT